MDLTNDLGDPAKTHETADFAAVSLDRGQDRAAYCERS